METNYTHQTALEFVIENCEMPEEVKVKIQTLLDGIIKAKANKKPSKAAVANEKFAEDTVKVMIEGRLYTQTELKEVNHDLMPFTPQKVSAILRKPILSKIIGRITKNGITYYYKGVLKEEI